MQTFNTFETLIFLSDWFGIDSEGIGFGGEEG